MRHLRAASLLAASAAVLCLTSPALADDGPAPAPAGEYSHHGMDREAWIKARQERRAHFLHDVLNIRPDQEAALQAFVAGMHTPGRDHRDGEAREARPEAPLTTPERLDRMAERMAKRSAERQAEFQRRVEAVKQFYAVLSPEQKRAFDALHARGDRGRSGLERHHGGPGERPGADGREPHGES